jgi:multidrug efflux system membrane fusion protein
LRFATVDSPIAGGIDQALTTEGALVSPSDTNPMAIVQQIDPVYVDVRQPASMQESIRASLARAQNETAAVTIVSGSGRPYPIKGKILFSGINVDPSTGDRVLRIQVDNPARTLLPGMYVRAKVPRGVPQQTFLLPQQAVQRAADGSATVWIIDAQNTASQRAVVLGEMVERQYMVSEGLKRGEHVVIEGQERLQEGVTVAARQWQAAHALADSNLPSRAAAQD